MSKNGGFLLGAFIGGTAAAITALLFAPKSGQELREDLANKTEEFKGAAKDYTDLAVDKGTEIKNAAVDATSDIKINLKETANQFASQLKQTSKEVISWGLYYKISLQKSEPF